MSESTKPVLLYALTTCGHCRNTKKFLEKCGIDYDCVNVDQTKGEEREALVKKGEGSQSPAYVPHPGNRRQGYRGV